MLRGRGEPVCSPNVGAVESGPMQVTVPSLNIHRTDALLQRAVAGSLVGEAARPVHGA